MYPRSNIASVTLPPQPQDKSYHFHLTYHASSLELPLWECSQLSTWLLGMGRSGCCLRMGVERKHIAVQLAGFYIVWHFGTNNIFAPVINGPSTPTSAWLCGLRISSILLMEASEPECSVNTSHDQICLNPIHGWGLQKAKCCSYSTDSSWIAGESLQLRLEAEWKKEQVKTQTYTECYRALMLVTMKIVGSWFCSSSQG